MGCQGSEQTQDPAAQCQETGAAPGLRLGKWPVRALDLVPGRGAELRKLGGWVRAQGWDPSSGAWPLDPYLRPWAEARALGSRPRGLVSRAGWAERAAF